MEVHFYVYSFCTKPLYLLGYDDDDGGDDDDILFFAQLT